MQNAVADRQKRHSAEKTCTPIVQESATKNQFQQRLNDKDYAEAVKKRGLNSDWVFANCRTMEKQEASERLRIDAKYGGIWLEGANGYGQFRPRKEFKTSKACKKALKYITAYGEDYDILLPNNPDDLRYWNDLKALKQQCYIINGYPCLGLTEGMFKAIAGCSNEIPTVALAGVEMGLTSSKNDVQGKRYLVPGLEDLARAGIGFVFLFDADAATNKNVNIAQRKLAHQLLKFKVPVYSCTGKWDESEGKGMDDYIKNNGADKFRSEVLAKAETIEKWEEQFKDGDNSNRKVTQGSLANDLLDKYRAKLAWNVPAKAWYQYEKKMSGVWSETPVEAVNMLVIDELNVRNAEYSYNFVAGVVSLLKSHLRIEEWEVIPDKVCLQDCVIDIHTLEETEHQPGYRFISRLPFKWSDREIGCEVIKEWLLSTCGDRDDWVEVIRAAMNATITERGAEFQRFMELVGVGGSGKGTILRLIQGLLGKENYTVTTLAQLEGNRFETATFFGKKAIFVTDAEKFSGEVVTLKATTGADPLRHEKKGVQMTGSFTFTGMVWVAANGAIQSTDYTNAMHRRRLSMLFDKCIPPSERRDLMKEFNQYLPGLLYWVLSMPADEVADYVRNTAKRVPSLGAFSVEILLNTNPLAEWADQHLYHSQGEETKVGSMSNDSKECLYASYAQWAIDNGRTKVSTKMFSETLITLLTTHLGINATKRRTKHGVHITEVGIRQPGHNFPLLLSGGEGLGEGSVKSKVKSETLASDGCEGSEGSFTSTLEVESHTQSTDSLTKEITESGKNVENPSNPSPVIDTTLHQSFTDEELTTPQPFTSQPQTVNNLTTKISETIGSDESQRFREGQTVFPTTGKYEGKQCRISAIDDNGIWAYPITTQLGVGAKHYKPSELSFTAPVKVETKEEYEVQPSIWDSEEYLEPIDD